MTDDNSEQKAQNLNEMQATVAAAQSKVPFSLKSNVCMKCLSSIYHLIEI